MNGFNGGISSMGLAGLGMGIILIYVIIFVVLFFFAILTAIVAGKKGRNAFGWFFIGLFTGIMGLTIALAILPRKYYVNDEIDDF